MGSPRVAGVTIPLFSIRTRRDWGIGQITDLPACAAWAQRAGMRLLQLLPVHELAAGETSPYGARTAFGLDPIYIGLESVPDLGARVIDESLGDDGRRTLERLRAARGVEYGAVRSLKERVLARGFERFHAREWKRDTARAGQLRAFIVEQRAWAEDLALYVALRERHAGYGWESWPAAERNREPQAMADAKSELELRILSHQYAQWIAHVQWNRARDEVRGLGVELMGDLPFIIGGESADVWSRAPQFRRDVSLGAPPDAYSDDGQDWGLPAYDWAAMDADDLAWLRARTRHAASLYDRFRLDHVVGYFRMYVKHAGQKGVFDPPNEEAQQARGERVLSAMQAEATGSRIIAEDLGVIPPFARRTLTKLGIPGYRVIPWEKDDGQGYRDTLRYPTSSVATWSTHDTAPIVAWWDDLPKGDREQLARMADLGADVSEPERSLALLRLLFASSSELALVLASEVLGQRDRINTPGTVDDTNWTYRLPMPLEDLERDPAALARLGRVRELVRASGR
jgi:4-alpha-glucanotransferase